MKLFAQDPVDQLAIIASLAEQIQIARKLHESLSDKLVEQVAHGAKLDIPADQLSIASKLSIRSTTVAVEQNTKTRDLTAKRTA